MRKSSEKVLTPTLHGRYIANLKQKVAKIEADMLRLEEYKILSKMTYDDWLTLQLGSWSIKEYVFMKNGNR